MGSWSSSSRFRRPVWKKDYRGCRGVHGTSRSSGRHDLAARWLLDTCVVSELSKPKPNEGLRVWLAEHVGDARLAAVTLGEIAYGIECLDHGAKRNGLQRWAHELQQRFK